MYKQTITICKPKRIRLFALIINCTILMKTNSRFSRNVYTISDRIWCNKHLTTQPRKNMETMGKVDTSDLMMIITWAIDIKSFQSPILKWASWTYTTLIHWWKIYTIRLHIITFFLWSLDHMQNAMVVMVYNCEVVTGNIFWRLSDGLNYDGIRECTFSVYSYKYVTIIYFLSQCQNASVFLSWPILLNSEKTWSGRTLVQHAYIYYIHI